MKLVLLVGALLLLVAIIFGVLWGYDNFDLSDKRIANDLQGKVINLSFNQYWPINDNQNLKLEVLGKKKLNDFYIVMAKISAITKVDTKEGEYPSDKMELNGVIRLTYEQVESSWYLLSVEDVSLTVKFVEKKHKN